MNPEPNQESPIRQPKRLIGYLIILGLLAIIVFFSIPSIIRQLKKADLVEAVSHTKHLSFTLFEFEDQYDSYPNNSTAAQIDQSKPAHSYDLSGKSSNAIFRQLFAADSDQNKPLEEIFYAKIKGSRKPDGNTSPGEALKKGEVSFSYISGLSSKDDPSTPIVLTPLIPGTTIFDPEPFYGKAVILHIDNSARVYTIHKDGHVYDKDGLDILSPKHPMWKGKAPDIRYPE